MAYFGQFYLDKEKDIPVRLDMEGQAMSYTISVNNHKTDNLINNFAAISGQTTTQQEGKMVITGQIPCYIKGDGRRVYILRLGGTKLANIYPDGQIEVTSVIPAIAKTLMSQTKDYRYSYRETLVKSYVPEHVKLTTDLHTHGNANLSADVLIALAIKHQIRYPLYYIKKLGLTLSDAQQRFLQEQRNRVMKTLDLSGLSGKHLDRRIDDNTYLNFADLIMCNTPCATENIQKIRVSLAILKDSQAVFTNLEKLYLYRYVFTKGKPADYRVSIRNVGELEDADIRDYLTRALADGSNPDYMHNTLYEDSLLWIGREYRQKHITHVQISDTTLVKLDDSNPKMLAQLHRILPLVKEETGVDIRFLAAIRRIPLTLVKDSIVSGDYLTQSMQALKVVCQDPYVVGSDFVGEEITDIAELRGVIHRIVRSVASCDPDWTIRVHAGENDTLKTNMAKAIDLVEEALLPGQSFPSMRIGHGLYCAKPSTQEGQRLLSRLKNHDVVLEFQLSSNVRLNNLMNLRQHPLKGYLQQGIRCVMGTDGCGLYGTDGIHEQLALGNFLGITDEEFLQMKAAEEAILSRQARRFAQKSEAFQKALDGRSVEEYYRQALDQAQHDSEPLHFEITKRPSYPVFRETVRELPWDKYPIVIAGGSFHGSHSSNRVSESDRRVLQALLEGLDPEKVFFVIGHRLLGHERYLVENNPGFDVYAIIPSMMSPRQMGRLEKARLSGVRISTESQEMGIYKSFNYEIFERRNCAVFAFDGNSAAANLVQEARNGKGLAKIFIYPNSPMLKAKAASLKGYVIKNSAPEAAVNKILQLQDNIGTKR